MIVRIRIAANMFEPTVGSVLKIGSQPSVPVQRGPERSVMNGPSTRIPQSPSTTLGIGRQQLDERSDRCADPARRELAQEERDRKRDRRGEEQCAERRDAVPKMNDLAPKSVLWLSPHA